MSRHKRCPFCDSSRLLALRSVFNTWRVKCLKCRAMGPEVDSERRAWAEWDRWGDIQRYLGDR